MRKLVFIYGCLLCSCASPSREWNTPEPLDDGWEIATPDQLGLEPNTLSQLIDNFISSNDRLDALVILKKNKLIVEEYANGFDANRLHSIWSITKLISGGIVGITVDNHHMALTDPISGFLDTNDYQITENWRAVQLVHVLQMTTGIQWVELGGPGTNNFELPYSNDWIQFVLNQPFDSKPGEKFQYSTGISMLLAPIVTSATEQQLDEYGQTHLFGPLGITHYQWDKQSEFWEKTQNGELPGANIPEQIDHVPNSFVFPNTGSGLHMRARDVAKIGQLYLDKGLWKDKRIMSEDWVKASTAPGKVNQDYGYHWRRMSIGNHSCYMATGFGLQRLVVVPDLDLVIVLFQSHYRTMPEGGKQTFNFLNALIHMLTKD